jgi:hypothetical protein
MAEETLLEPRSTGARSRGWTVVSMKDDRKTVFAPA